MEPEIESETTPLRSRVAISADVVQVDFVQEPEPEPMAVSRCAHKKQRLPSRRHHHTHTTRALTFVCGVQPGRACVRRVGAGCAGPH